MPEKGQRAPDFSVETTQGAVRLSELLKRGKVVLTFYVEDGTPTCDQQLCVFRDEHATVSDLGAQVLAISADTLERHAATAEKLRLPFLLGSDPDLCVARLLYGAVASAAPGGITATHGAPATHGALGQSKRARSATFVIDTDGVIIEAIPWYNPGNTGQLMQVFGALGLEG